MKSLEKILGNQKQRGIFGEIQLENLLSNVLPPQLFQMQYSFKNNEVVDAIVKVNNFIIPIDAKFSLDNYNKMVESLDKEELKKHVDHTNHCIELAYKMGIPCLRLNTGRWNTIKSFDDLMKNRGIEPILPGYTEDDGYKWCVDGIQQCLNLVAQLGQTSPHNLVVVTTYGILGNVSPVRGDNSSISVHQIIQPNQYHRLRTGVQ